MASRPMGIVCARVTVYSPDLSRSEKVDAIVDTGSTLTWLPEDVALRLGLRPTEMDTFRTGDGRVVERPIGDAHIECEGRRRSVTIAYARPGDACVLGVTALEAMKLEVDPVTRTLRRGREYLALRFAA